MTRHQVEDDWGHRQTRRLHARLQKVLRRLGPGSVRRLEQQLGVRDGWLRYKRHRGTLDVPHFLQILRILDLDPSRFVADALGESAAPEASRTPGVDQDHAPPEPAKGKPPTWVRRARRQFDRRRHDRRQLTDGPPLADSLLQELDHTRRTDPTSTLRHLETHWQDASLGQLPRLLGIAGSTWRHLFQLDKAHHALHHAWQMARELHDRALEADLLQRLGYVLADGGEHGVALRLARQAGELYLQLADLEGIGRAFVDQGTWLFYLDRGAEAIQVLDTALLYLPPQSQENRCAALHNLSLSHRQLGQLQRASDYAGQARALEKALDASGRARLIWLQGRLAGDLGQLDEAQALLAQAAGRLVDLHPADGALATIEQVHILLRQGHNDQAFEIAKSMIRLVEPLKDRPMISAALAELLRCCLSGGRLTTPLVAGIERQLRRQASPKPLHLAHLQRPESG